MADMKEFENLSIQLEAIKSATDNFDEKKVIGRGGFGKVYEGERSHSKGRSVVAFKRLDRKHGQGEPEFLKEIMMLSRYSDENLICLLGFCSEGGEKVLIYEHACHGSLDRHLNSDTFTWKQRLKICLDAARGLSYLHDPRGTSQRVIHCDIKSANILLDKEMNAKLSDFGLSKIGPANQQYTYLVSNVGGTIGYCDPLYLDTGFLTKESDVYSFGVLLFEVLCGKVCFEIRNDLIQILVPRWKETYEKKKLEEIIFEVIMQQMDPLSLKIFSDIAYQCLGRSRAERPAMANVVKELEIALETQEISEGKEQLIDYEEMCQTAVPPLNYKSKAELNILLSKGVLLNNGKTWFSVNKNGEHCEMISIAECLIPSGSKYDLRVSDKSRFGQYYYAYYDETFSTHVRAQFLSPQTTYLVNLVFKDYRKVEAGKQIAIDIKYKLLQEKIEPQTLYLVDGRHDGWWGAELFLFTAYTRIADFDIKFSCKIIHEVEGIEFQPLEKVNNEVLEEPVSDLDKDWEPKLPNDYKEIIKLAKDSVQWTTKKELYFLLCKGFLINNGEQWFSLTKNGKKCYVLPARSAFVEEEWKWMSLPESRFDELAQGLSKYSSSVSVVCTINSQMLSSQTTYASYLVYKLPENYSEFERPIKVSEKDIPLDEFGDALDDVHYYIYLVSPQIPIIRLKDDPKAHNSMKRQQRKYHPQLRDDGWMEVRIWEFLTGATSEIISMSISIEGKFFGLIVQGIEYKPI